MGGVQELLVPDRSVILLDVLPPIQKGEEGSSTDSGWPTAADQALSLTNSFEPAIALELKSKTGVQNPDHVQPNDPAALQEDEVYPDNSLAESCSLRSRQDGERLQSVLLTDGATTAPSVARVAELEITGKEVANHDSNVLLVANPPQADVPGHVGEDPRDGEARGPI